MANIKNWTYKGHNWIRTFQTPNTRTMSFRSCSLLTDEEYKKYMKDFKENPHTRPTYRRLKETDREFVEFSFERENAPEVIKK